ncbi:hypothetical protein [Methanobrevibacter gottschalkii]|uniref:hypothetical protein n=1 Tax=Methanobrevibacter gottschalkii TaxID=190974 RepID=UPI0038D16BE4
MREALDPFVAAGELESADGSVKIVYAADALPENTVVTVEEQHDPLGDGKPAYCLTVELENDGDWVRPTAGTAIIMIKLPEEFNVADRAQLGELYGALMVHREAWIENGYICSEMESIGAEAFSTYIITLKEETQPQKPPAEEPVTNPPAATDPAPQGNDAPQNFFQRITYAFTNFFASIRSFFAKLFGL